MIVQPGSTYKNHRIAKFIIFFLNSCFKTELLATNFSAKLYKEYIESLITFLVCCTKQIWYGAI